MSDAAYMQTTATAQLEPASVLRHVVGGGRTSFLYSILRRHNENDAIRQAQTAHNQLALNSRTAHNQLTTSSQSAHNQLTVNSQSTHSQLTVNSQSTHGKTKEIAHVCATIGEE